MAENEIAIDHAIRLLEFPEIRARVSEYCLSEDGRLLVCASMPERETEPYLALKKRVMQCLDALTQKESFPQTSYPIIKDIPAKLAKPGTFLEIDELFALGSYLKSSIALKRFFSDKDFGESIRGLAEALPELEACTREIFKVLTPDGALRELPEIRDIKKRIFGIHKEIQSITQGYLTAESTKSLLQSELPTQRDGRTVLAVKVNYKGRIKGIVHEVSSTGQTVYIEPEELVEKNNRLVEEDAQLRMALVKILRGLTEAISIYAPDIVTCIEATAMLDSIYARAEYSRKTRGQFALEGEIPRPGVDARYGVPGLCVYQAKHPLLGASAIPIDIVMEEGIRSLVVTGPNTGGKTVSLKTVGLLALMNQFGLAIPASERSSIPLFDGVYADIGDEQSISQSLSTFSGHMKNLASILGGATGDSLVMLDELGSGTDPEEGSAIAMAVLDELIALGACVIVTTHHGILKNYGYTKKGVLNASMDFNRESLEPTYKILLGIPGESHAIDIASRNGLPHGLVKMARSYLSEERTNVSALIAGLREKHKELENLEGAHVKGMKELAEKRRETDLKELKLRQEERDMRRLGVGQLNRLLSESRKELENLVREIKEGELSKEKIQRAKEFIKGVAEAQAREMRTLEEEEEKLREEQRFPDGSKAVFAPGLSVLVGKRKSRGKIVRAAKKGEWVVLVDSVRLSMPESELLPVMDLPKAKPEFELSSSGLSGSAKPVYELNLLGMRLEEALEAMARQMDAATLASLAEFSVVHGKGNGVLQQGVHNYLKSCPQVAEFFFARPEHGGSGKTIVLLKR